MTNQEAISAIQTAKGECEWNAPIDYQIAFDMAIEALKKQIPRKYVLKDGYSVCANCEETIVNDYYYCPNCGQAHDQLNKWRWGKDDE